MKRKTGWEYYKSAALIEMAIPGLRIARDRLRAAGAANAADAVARALKSADGALRNARRFADKESTP